jgi:hypothetical protein
MWHKEQHLDFINLNNQYTKVFLRPTALNRDNTMFLLNTNQFIKFQNRIDQLHDEFKSTAVDLDKTMDIYTEQFVQLIQSFN